MERNQLTALIVCVLAIVLGVLLHDWYTLWPNLLTAMLSPVEESIWEHLKLFVWPYLLAMAVLTWGQEASARTPYYATLLVMCLLMLGVGYLYHIVLGQEAVWVDIGLYLLLMVAGFFILPQKLAWLSQSPVAVAVVPVLLLIWVGLVILITFFPPSHPLFIDPRVVPTFGYLM